MKLILTIDVPDVPEICDNYQVFITSIRYLIPGIFRTSICSNESIIEIKITEPDGRSCTEVIE